MQNLSLLETRIRLVECKAASFFASTLPEQLFFNLKMKLPLKNLRIYAKHVLAINTKHGPTQSHKIVPLKVFSYSKFNPHKNGPFGAPM